MRPLSRLWTLGLAAQHELRDELLLQGWQRRPHSEETAEERENDDGDSESEGDGDGDDVFGLAQCMYMNAWVAGGGLLPGGYSEVSHSR